MPKRRRNRYLQTSPGSDKASIVQIDQYRQTGKRRRSSLRSHWPTLFLLLIIAMSAGTWYVLTRTPYLKVKQVVIAGNSRLSVDSIQAASGIHLEDRPWQHIPSNVTTRLRQGQPWIKTAAVTLNWRLDSVTIHVTEREPSFVLSHKNGWVTVDETGVILELIDSPGAAGLPIISGLEIKDAVPGQRVEDHGLPDAAYLLNWMSPSLQKTISEVHVNAARQVSLYMQGGLVVEWGIVPVADREAAVKQKLGVLGGLLKDALGSDKPICRIDIRDEAKAFLRPCP